MVNRGTPTPLSRHPCPIIIIVSNVYVGEEDEMPACLYASSVFCNKMNLPGCYAADSMIPWKWQAFVISA